MKAMNKPMNTDSILSSIPQKGRRGLKPGQVHSGSFKKGPDPRRFKHDEERRKARMTIEDLCRQYTDEAVGFMAGLLNDPKASNTARLEAAKQILDRGHGQAVSRVVMASVDHTGNDPSKLGLDELLKLCNDSIEREVTEDDQSLVIEGEFESDVGHQSQGEDD